MSGFKASKSFEGAGPVLIWAATTRLDDGSWWKGYVVADAQQKSFGVRLESERSDDLKLNGGVVTMVRKHARTASIGAVLADPVSGHIWLPLFTGEGYSESPRFWLQLAHGLPPELRFIDASGTALIRKSSQGTYTKRWTLDVPLPSYPPGPELLDLIPTLLAALGKGGGEGRDGERDQDQGKDESKGEGDAEELRGDEREATAGAVLLPDYQRAARDRLSRRLKTLRKTALKLEQQAAKAATSGQLALQAEQLGAFLHRVRPEAIELRLAAVETGLSDDLVIALDPEKSPGQNLTELHTASKKARRAAGTLATQLATLRLDLAALAIELERLRSTPLPLAVVEQLLLRFHLTKASQAQAPDEAKGPSRTFYWLPTGSTEAAAQVRILVGKSAADSDELCRKAKGHDLWVHVVGTTGSHVIIPFRQLKQGIDQQLVRTAAILALHYSKLRGDERGEVYVSRRQHIKKRKGMAPGLWQIDQAETLFCRYDATELQHILNQKELT